MHCRLLEPCGLAMASAEVRQPSQEPLLEQRRRNHVVERGLDILCNRAGVHKDGILKHSQMGIPCTIALRCSRKLL